MNTTPHRSSAIDLTKCMAVCAVLLIHCSAGRFSLYEIGSLPWLVVLLSVLVAALSGMVYSLLLAFASISTRIGGALMVIWIGLLYPMFH